MAALTNTGVRALRQHLAEAVRRAAAGEITVVTVAGRPAARLGPIDEAAPTLAQLLACGSLVAPRRTSEWRSPAAVAIGTGVRIDRALRELRG